MSRFLTSNCLRAALSLVLVSAPHFSYAIVSERHLKGVSALQCDLEIEKDQPSVAFTLLVNVKERRLRLADTSQVFPYKDASETTMRFELALPSRDPMACDLEMPAGALSCVDPKNPAQPRLGLCFPRS